MNELFNDKIYQLICSELSALVKGHLGSTAEIIMDVGVFGLLSARAWQQEPEDTWQICT
jgi:hypothetical protein